jgi:PIN domain nuclease of toxin-antitoxin system
MSEKSRKIILNPDNSLLLSAASYWEICLKHSVGKLTLSSDWITVFDREMNYNAILWLEPKKAHLQKIVSLPWHHRDPFDRLLVAQALCEHLTIITADPDIKKYAVPTLW